MVAWQKAHVVLPRCLTIVGPHTSRTITVYVKTSRYDAGQAQVRNNPGAGSRGPGTEDLLVANNNNTLRFLLSAAHLTCPERGEITATYSFAAQMMLVPVDTPRARQSETNDLCCR